MIFNLVTAAATAPPRLTTHSTPLLISTVVPNITPKPYIVAIDNVMCSVCDDVGSDICSMVNTRCGANEVCQFQQKATNGPATTQCVNVCILYDFQLLLY